MSDHRSKSGPLLVVNDSITVHFDEDWDVGIGGGLWSTGLALAHYFVDHSSFITSTKLFKKDKMKIVELGSGNGFLSVVLAAVLLDKRCCLDAELYVTDLGDHLELIRRTIRENKHIVSSDGINRTDRINVKVAEYSWGMNEIDAESDKFDFIFGSDVAYRDYLHAPLIASLSRLSHDNTISLIGVTMADTKPKFFEALGRAGFKYTRLSDGLMRPEFRGTTFGIFAIQKKRSVTK